MKKLALIVAATLIMGGWGACEHGDHHGDHHHSDDHGQMMYQGQPGEEMHQGGQPMMHEQYSHRDVGE